MNTGKLSFSTPLKLKFKGSRQYLHGTDILNASLNVVEERYPKSTLSDVDIAFHCMAKTGLTLVKELPKGNEFSAQLKLMIDGVQDNFFLIEDGRPILESYEYDEENIIQVTNIQEDIATATSTSALPYTNIERWVTMVKALHHALYPELNGKWLFARGHFDSYHEKYDRLHVRHQVTVESNFNNKLTRSTLLIDGLRVGDIFFTLD